MEGRDGEYEPEKLFNEIYDHHHRTLHAYFVARTGDGNLALDLLQEAFLRLWRNLESLQERSVDRHGYWLFAVARNLVTDHHRSAAIRARHGTEEPVEDIATSSPSPEAQVEQREELRTLDEAIKLLPEDLRTVLLMQHLGEMSSAQVGAVLGKPPGTVRYLASQARKRLVKEVQTLSQEEGEGVDERILSLRQNGTMQQGISSSHARVTPNPSNAERDAR
jgi:RNA polymerase sigma-70 factor (ECF subfamily)